MRQMKSDQAHALFQALAEELLHSVEGGVEGTWFKLAIPIADLANLKYKLFLESEDALVELRLLLRLEAGDCKMLDTSHYVLLLVD